MQKFVRFSIGYVVVFYLVSMLVNPYSSPEAIKNYTVNDWFIFIVIFLFFANFFFLWIYFLYNWGTKTFVTKNLKRLWFLILLLGGPFYFLGPLSYYILIFEMGKGLHVDLES